MDIDTEEYIQRIQALNAIKDRYEFTTSSQPKISPNLLLWNFMRDEEYKVECQTFLDIMETEKAWEKLRNSHHQIKLASHEK